MNFIQDAIHISKEYFLFHHLRFIAAARSTDLTRDILTHIAIQRDGLILHLAATDGRRLHYYTLDPGLFDDDLELLDPGLYTLLHQNSKQIILKKSDHYILDEYPKYQDLIPNTPTDNFTSVNNITIGKILLRTQILINIDYLIAAAGYGNGRKPTEDCDLNYSTPAENEPLLLKHNLGTALIMPIKDDKEDEE